MLFITLFLIMHWDTQDSIKYLKLSFSVFADAFCDKNFVCSILFGRLEFISKTTFSSPLLKLY